MGRGRLLLAFAVIALLSASASARTGPCSGGGPNPLFTVYGANPVLLTFEHATSFRLFAPRVSTVGNDITVVQDVDDIPPNPGSPLPSCNMQTISLGALAPGWYNVTWRYEPLETSFNYAFVVPDTVPAMNQPALLALMFLCAAIGAAMLRR